MSVGGYLLPGIATSAFGTCDPPRSDSVSAGRRIAGAPRFWEGDTMGLLDDLLGNVLGGGLGQQGGRCSRVEAAGRGRAGGGGLGDILGQVLGGGAPSAAGGGLGGLLKQMQRAGFGGQARSWVSTGQNMPVSPDAFGQIFGEGGLEEIARRANLTPQQTSEGLSQLLPEVVDRVTPGGRSRTSTCSPAASMISCAGWERDLAAETSLRRSPQCPNVPNAC